MKEMKNLVLALILVLSVGSAPLTLAQEAAGSSSWGLWAGIESWLESLCAEIFGEVAPPAASPVHNLGEAPEIYIYIIPGG